MVIKNINFYPKSSAKELDLRKEFRDTLLGTQKEISKKQIGLLRKFRRNNNKQIKCPCVSPVTNEPDKEIKCPVCLGEGYLWDETEIRFYKRTSDTASSNTRNDKQRKHSIVSNDNNIFYLESTFDLTSEDKIVILALDKDGSPIKPYTRIQLFRIALLKDMRLDDGKLEFWTAYCYEDNNKFL